MTEYLVKRIYDPPSPQDRCRILVDRIWPRGISKQAAMLDSWLKEIAPSQALRKWFNHRPDKWPEFCQWYAQELAGEPDAWRALVRAGHRKQVTLLYAARDRSHNNAVALQLMLKAKSTGSRQNTRPTRPRARKRSEASSPSERPGAPRKAPALAGP